MANKNKDINSSKKRRRNRTYKKDELMDEVDKAFHDEKGKQKNKEKFDEVDYAKLDSLIVPEGEFYSTREASVFNADEEEYFAEMEKTYGSKLKQKKEEPSTDAPTVPDTEPVEEPPVDNPTPPEVVEDSNIVTEEEEDFLDKEMNIENPKEEMETPKHEEAYFAEMEKIYGSRLEKTPETVPETVPEETITEDVEEEVPDSEEEVVEEDMSKKEEEKVQDTDTFDTELMSKIGDDLERDIRTYQYGSPDANTDHVHKHKINIIVLITSGLAVLFSVIYFFLCVLNSGSSILSIIGSAALTLFAILFMVVCVTSHRKNILPMVSSSLLLVLFFILSFFGPKESVVIRGNKVQNFSGKNLTEVVKWANKNKIKITQEYEYSDMVPEYEVISQSVKPGTNLKDIDEIVVSISEGPNPYKEIIVPSMLTWDAERVVNFIKTNHLSNVLVDFVESDKLKDTVIEQNRSGNMMRNEELKLVFSYGDQGNSSEVTLVDFTKMDKFEIEFFMKQHKINYEILFDFDEKAKKGYGMKQSVAAGTVVRVQGDKVQVTISKGPKIEIPDLKGLSVDDITEWAIKNKLKLEFVDQYDATIKYGDVISVDKEKGSVVEQGTVIKITLSLGGLKMPKFKNVDAFYQWADKYGIKYETKHEFSNTVDAGEVIEYSYKSGQTIKNNDPIIVTISDGKKMSVPNLKGLSKSEAIKKLKAADLNYNFVYRSNDASKDTVIGQSISAGSEVSSGTTVTVTLSSGKSEDRPKPSPSPSSNPSPSPSPSPTQTCNACSVTRLTKVWSEVGEDKMNYQNIANALIAEIEGQCPGIDVQVRGDTSSGEPAGTFISGFSGGDTDENGKPLTSCSVVHIYLAK